MLGVFKLAERVSELEESVERIEKAYKRLEMEWTDVYDKFRQLHFRVAKRQKAIEDAELADNQNAGSENPAPEPQDGGSSGLTPRALQAQQRILALRARRNGGM